MKLSHLRYVALAGLVGGLFALPPAIAKMWPSVSGTTTPGVVLENGTDGGLGSPLGTAPAGTVIGGVSRTVSVCVTPTVTATNSYGTNFVVGGLLTFANAFTATGSGILQNVSVTIKASETSGFTFYPFISNPSNTTWTDAAVAAINAADVAKVRGAVPLAQAGQLAATGFSTYYAYGLGHALAPGATSLYGVLLANAALTTQFAAASDVQVCLKIIQDP